jgi:outer membrane protein OmpA-like peptidoglycan-associated protein
MGKTVPLSPNQKADGSDDPEGRSRNRRAEIFLDF